MSILVNTGKHVELLRSRTCYNFAVPVRRLARYHGMAYQPCWQCLQSFHRFIIDLNAGRLRQKNSDEYIGRVSNRKEPIHYIPVSEFKFTYVDSYMRYIGLPILFVCFINRARFAGGISPLTAQPLPTYCSGQKLSRGKRVSLVTA